MWHIILILPKYETKLLAIIEAPAAYNNVTKIAFPASGRIVVRRSSCHVSSSPGKPQGYGPSIRTLVGVITQPLNKILCPS